LSAGDTAKLDNWSLALNTEVTTVPEPGALMPLGALCAGGLLLRTRSRGTV
jgi:hypothetical protein